VSIARLILRATTRKALMGRTWAEGRVFDSAITEIDQTVMETRRPLIVVTTDDEEGQVDGRDILGAMRSLDLVIEVAVATFVRTEDGGVTITLPDTDEGLEVTVDLMCRQVIRALQSATGEWPALWRRLVPAVRTVSQRRGADAKNGIRFAARQIVLTVTSLADPLTLPGEPVDGDVFAAFLALAETDDEIAPLAQVIRAALTDDVPDWRLAQALLGLSDPEADMMGLAPIPAGEAPALITAGELGEGAGYDDADDIAANLPDPPDA
jgi:hypothetical protein